MKTLQTIAGIASLLSLITLASFLITLIGKKVEYMQQDAYQPGINHVIDSIEEHLIKEYWEETDSTIIVTQTFEK